MSNRSAQHLCKVMHCISKLHIYCNYKVYRNGTVVFDTWDGGVPTVDKQMKMGNGLYLMFELSRGFGCHILTDTYSIAEAQRYIEEDLEDGTVVFDSSIDNINERLTSMYVFITSKLTKTFNKAKLSMLAMKKVMENRDSIDNYDTWDRLGQNIMIYEADDDMMNRMNRLNTTYSIKDTNRNSAMFDKPLCVVHIPDFISNLPDVKNLPLVK